MSTEAKIKTIGATIFRLPLHTPLRWGKASILTEVKHVAIHVRLSDGSSGWAEAPPRPTIYGETTESITSIIKNEIEPRILGEPARDAMARLNQIKNNHTARGAVDIAIHNALAQSAGQSITHYLGCTTEKIRVSYILGIGTHDEVLREAERVYQLGVRVLKVKVGRNWAEDIERIKLLNEQYDDLDLYADANECLTADEAPKKLAQLRELGLLYCEEPLPVEYIQERGKLKQGNHIPIIGDDSTFTSQDLYRELSIDTFDVLNIKTARTGYSQSLTMRKMALDANKGIMLGSQASTLLGTKSTGLFAALPGIEHPSELSFYLNAKEDIVNNKPIIENGYIKTADLAAVQVDKKLLHEASV